MTSRRPLREAALADVLDGDDIELDALASTPVDGEELAWEAGYNPLPSIVESANALAWHRYGAAHVRLSTGDGATWTCTAVDAEGRAIESAPVHVDTTPEDAVSGWITLAERHAAPAADVGPSERPRPLTLREAFPEGLSFSLADESAPVIDRATGDVVEVIETAARAEAA